MTDMCLDVCLDVVILSPNRYFCCGSFPIFTKLGTHDLCANTEKNCGPNYRNFDFKTFGDFFLNFKFGLSLWNGSRGAI